MTRSGTSSWAARTRVTRGRARPRTAWFSKASRATTMRSATSRWRSPAGCNVVDYNGVACTLRNAAVIPVRRSAQLLLRHSRNTGWWCEEVPQLDDPQQQGEQDRWLRSGCRCTDETPFRSPKGGTEEPQRPARRASARRAGVRRPGADRRDDHLRLPEGLALLLAQRLRLVRPGGRQRRRPAHRDLRVPRRTRRTTSTRCTPGR